MKRRLVQKLTTEGTPLTAALQAAELASSSYYYHPADKRKPRALDMELVAAIALPCPTYLSNSAQNLLLWLCILVCTNSCRIT